jgi:peptidase E
MRGSLHLLGPQRTSPNLPAVLHQIPGEGPTVTITAGWRNEEGDDEALRQDIGGSGVMLPLYRWFDELTVTAPTLIEAHGAQQREIRALKQLYRLRLEPGILALRSLVAHRARHPDRGEADAEIADAISSLVLVRERFVTRADEVRRRFAERYRPFENEHVRLRIDEIRRVLAEARAVCIAGGHVGVLRNRIEFFDFGAALEEAFERGTSVIGWSAGAMVLTERVVLFHDDPPVAQANAELLDRGLGLAKRLVVLPHARERLFLDDPVRVGILAARFSPIPVLGLENGAWLREENGWVNAGTRESVVRLWPDGRVTPFEVVHA